MGSGKEITQPKPEGPTKTGPARLRAVGKIMQSNREKGQSQDRDRPDMKRGEAQYGNGPYENVKRAIFPFFPTGRHPGGLFSGAGRRGLAVTPVADAQAFNPPRISVNHFKLNTVRMTDHFAAFRNPARQGEYQPA